jgi:hypothetical protein
MSYQPLFLGLGTAVFRTNTDTNILEGETADLRVGQLIKFISEGNGFIFGGVTANTVYYIKEIINSNEFKVSATLNGGELELVDGEGFMLVRPIQREQNTESLRKVDSMLKEIYTGGIDGDGVGILSVAEDLSPSLGGNLNLDGNDIVGTGDINITGTVNATIVTGNLRGVVAGGLIGPVDAQGVRTGNPTIDGLPFELGNPTGGQVISWDAPNSKFVLTSVSAVSGSDTLDDVLFRGNTSLNSITVSRATTPEVEGVNDELNIYSNWAKDTGISIYSENNLESVTLTSDRIVAVVTNVGPSQKQWFFEENGNFKLPAGGDIVDTSGVSVLGGGGGDIGNFIFTANDASLIPGSTMTLSTYQSGGNKESKLTLSTSGISSLDVGNNLRITTGYGTGFEKVWSFGATGSITWPDATIQTTAFTGSNIPSQTGNDGKYLTTSGSTLSWATVSGLSSRTSASATTGALLVNAIGNISITGFKTYALLAMTVEIPAWVRLYTSSAARTADASRLETEDPLPGSGVIAEVITTSNNQSVLFTPAVIGFNGATPATTTIFAAVKNKGGGLATIQVTLNLLQLEA